MRKLRLKAKLLSLTLSEVNDLIEATVTAQIKCFIDAAASNDYVTRMEYVQDGERLTTLKAKLQGLKREIQK